MSSNIPIHNIEDVLNKSVCECRLLTKEKICIYGNACPAIKNPNYSTANCGYYKGYLVTIDVFQHYAENLSANRNI
ncbi:MAG: hypothetical protein WC781_03095 [Candidatus Pacearchaeota archaeon]|jgi:hypothetical protein